MIGNFSMSNSDKLVSLLDCLYVSSRAVNYFRCKNVFYLRGSTSPLLCMILFTTCALKRDYLVFALFNVDQIFIVLNLCIGTKLKVNLSADNFQVLKLYMTKQVYWLLFSFRNRFSTENDSRSNKRIRNRSPSLHQGS